MKHLSLTKPHLIIMVGIPGSGKSFFAEKFANTFGSPYICDKKIASLVQGKIDAVVQLQLDELLKTKQSIIFDGSSDTRVERMALTKKARTAGYESLLIWVQTDQATAKARVTQDKKGSASLSVDEYDRRRKRFTPPNVTEKPLVISGKHTYASQAKVVLKKLSAPRAEIADHDKPPLRPERPKGRIVIR
jgi:predicted kinase